jgi:hypothetical protein
MFNASASGGKGKADGTDTTREKELAEIMKCKDGPCFELHNAKSVKPAR